MSIAYEKKVSPIEMQDGRRRAWVVPGKPGHFEVISRDSTTRYAVEVVNGIPLCNCIAGTGDNGRFRPQPCWHAALVLARLEREAASKPPEPTDAELFAMVGA